MSLVWVVQYQDTNELFGVFALREAAFAHITQEYKVPHVRWQRESTDHYSVVVHTDTPEETVLERFKVYSTTVLGEH